MPEKPDFTDKLLNRLSVRADDTDQMIEAHEGRAITEIFSIQGEEAFRRMETELLRRLTDASSCPSDPEDGFVLSVGINFVSAGV